MLVRVFAARSLDRRWLRPIGLLVVAGLVTGAGWKVVTAGVIGANIGGTWVVLLGVLVIVLVVAAAVTCVLRPGCGPGS